MIPKTHPVLCVVQPEQKQQWDQFVAEQPTGHLLQSWGWGEIKASSGWQPLRLALYEQGRIVAAAQVLQRGAPRLPLQLGHLAYVPKGPVLDWSQPELCTTFFRALRTNLTRRGALALRIEPAVEAASPEGEQVLHILTTLALQPIHAVQPLRTIILDLTPDEETLLAQMKEKWRYNVRVATRKGVHVRVATLPEDVRMWYTLYQTTGERDHFGIHTLDYYLHVWETLAPHNQLRLLLAEHEGQLLAGIFVGLFAGQGIYLYGASSNEQRQLMPNYLLQWEAMRWVRQEGAHSYDLWGIPDTDDPDEAMAGVYRFKRGWGGRLVQFPGGYEQVYRPQAMHIVRRWLD